MYRLYNYLTTTVLICESAIQSVKITNKQRTAVALSGKKRLLTSHAELMVAGPTETATTGPAVVVVAGPC